MIRLKKGKIHNPKILKVKRKKDLPSASQIATILKSTWQRLMFNRLDIFGDDEKVS